MTRRLWMLCLLPSLFAGCGSSRAVPPPAPSIVTTYTPDTTVFVNPERGFYRYTSLHQLDPEIGAIRETEGISLVWGRIHMAAYRDEPELPADFLAAVTQGFDTARQAGMKVIVRGAYGSRGPGGDYTTYADPPAAHMRRHIEQLAPIFEANKDVIALFEAGFIGPWGEWHTTQIANDYDAGRAFFRHLINHTPRSRMVLLRYPLLKQEMFRTTEGGFDRVTEANAYTGTPVARTGHHNDCFLSSDTDLGTYNRGEMDRAAEEAYLAGETLYTVFGGETCSDFRLNDCAAATAAMRTLHASYLNSGWHPDVLAKWEAQGCMQDVKRDLGARFELRRSQVQGRALAGSTLRVQIALENVGYAPLYNARDAVIVLRNERTGRVWRLPLDVDPRDWKPGQPVDVDMALPLPTRMTPGPVTVFLHLADPSPRLRDDARFAYRIASQGVWDEGTGWNRLAEGAVIAEP